MSSRCGRLAALCPGVQRSRRLVASRSSRCGRLGTARQQWNYRRILANGGDEGDLHLLGHKQGFRTACIWPRDLVDGVLAAKEYRASAMHARMSVWHETGAAAPSGVSLQPWEAPTCVPKTDCKGGARQWRCSAHRLHGRCASVALFSSPAARAARGQLAARRAGPADKVLVLGHGGDATTFFIAASVCIAICVATVGARLNHQLQGNGRNAEDME